LKQLVINIICETTTKLDDKQINKFNSRVVQYACSLRDK